MLTPSSLPAVILKTERPIRAASLMPSPLGVNGFGLISTSESAARPRGTPIDKVLPSNAGVASPASIVCQGASGSAPPPLLRAASTKVVPLRYTGAAKVTRMRLPSATTDPRSALPSLL